MGEWVKFFNIFSKSDPFNNYAAKVKYEVKGGGHKYDSFSDSKKYQIIKIII